MPSDNVSRDLSARPRSGPELPNHQGHQIDDVGAAGQHNLAFDPGTILGTIDLPEETAEPALMDAEPRLERIGE